MTEINYEQLRAKKLLGESEEKFEDESLDKGLVAGDIPTVDMDLNNDGVFDEKDKSIAGKVLRAKKLKKAKSTKGKK
jgi:hypothetical protein